MTPDDIAAWLRAQIAERRKWLSVSYNVADVCWINWASAWLHDIETGRWPSNTQPSS